MNDTQTYIFVGVVHPTRAAFNLLDVGEIEMRNPHAGVAGKFLLTVLKGHATLRYRSEQPIEDLATARNVIQDAASVFIDLYCLDKVLHYTLELFQVTNVDTFQTVVFGIDRKISRPEGPDFDFDLGKLFEVAGQQPLFRRALIDFRRAVGDPAESGFLCYRAFESVLQQYKNDMQTTDKKKAIAALSKDIGLSNESADFLMNAAGDVRHGKVKFVSGAEADRALSIVRSVLIRFAQRTVDSKEKWNDEI